MNSITGKSIIIYLILYEINFTKLNNEYLTNWEGVGGDTYEITYNQNNQKKILDENDRKRSNKVYDKQNDAE